jgi:hypothetical protein
MQVRDTLPELRPWTKRHQSALTEYLTAGQGRAKLSRGAVLLANLLAAGRDGGVSEVRAANLLPLRSDNETHQKVLRLLRGHFPDEFPWKRETSRSSRLSPTTPPASTRSWD